MTFPKPSPVRSQPVAMPRRGQIVVLILCLVLGACGDSDPSEQKAEKKVDENQEVMSVKETLEAESLPDLKTIPVRIFYKHPETEGLIAISTEIFDHPSLENKIKQIIDHLSIPPSNNLGEALWPSYIHIREVFLLEDGTIVIDFGSDFLSRINAGSNYEHMLVAALVNSLLYNLEDFQKVSLLVDGEPRSTFLGHVDISKPLAYDRGIYEIVSEVLDDDRVMVEDLEDDEQPGLPQR